MFSKSIKGTAPNKVRMNWWQYWIGHCWMTGWQSMRMTFNIWSDLMRSNYDNYALMRDEDPEAECIEWFWVSLNEDDTYPKEFLEELMQMVDDIETGKVETIPMDDLLEDLRKSLEEDAELTENK